MNIAEYLASSGTTQTEFAKKVGVSQGVVSMWVKGKAKVAPEKWQKIYIASEGNVKLIDLRPDLFPFSPIDGSSL